MNRDLFLTLCHYYRNAIEGGDLVPASALDALLRDATLEDLFPDRD